jgi:hypothetical protein
MFLSIEFNFGLKITEMHVEIGVGGIGLAPLTDVT